MLHKRAGLHILVIAPGRRPADAIERALARLSGEQRIPHEIHVLGPRDRLLEVQREFVAPASSRFGDLCAALGFPRDEILFNQRTLHAIDPFDSAHDVPGTAEDCGSEADRILHLLRQLASSHETSLTVVVADDAGAVGHVLHGALQMVGRPADRLLLDLSSSEPRRRGSPRRREAATRHVQVPLLLWPANEPVPPTYAEAVRRRRIERRRVSEPDVLRLDCPRRIVSVGETTVALPAMQFFWLYYLAATPRERFPLAELTNLLGTGRRQPPHLTQKLSDGRVRVFPADLQRGFVQLFPHAADKFDAMLHRACGQHPGLPSTISKINAALRRALGRGAGPYLIQGGRGAGGYRVTLPPSAIQIVGVDGKRGI